MWNKQDIQVLKQRAYACINDDDIRDHLSALNIHLNNYEKKPLFHEKNQQWRQAEYEADLISNLLDSLPAGRQSLN
jgi:hypothetical protein